MLTEGLLPWYVREKRDLPWRHSREPYRIWISEVMLQQTRVEAVKPYYERFLRALPDVNALANVDEEMLLKLWEGLGYYSRARNLQAAARQIQEMGEFPHTAQGLKALKGFGDYTAGAVASIAFGERAAAVDGNVLRVYARLERMGESIKLPSVRRDCARAVLESLPQDADAGDYNQALMELGATICTPRSPKCGRCPLQSGCLAHQEGDEENYPVKDPKPGKAVESFDVYWIEENGRVRVRKRPKTGLLAGLWEFPHHLETVQAGDCVCQVRHVFTHKIWLMRFVRAACGSGAGTDAWVTREELAALPMASAMEKFRRIVLDGE